MVVRRVGDDGTWYAVQLADAAALAAEPGGPLTGSNKGLFPGIGQDVRVQMP